MLDLCRQAAEEEAVAARCTFHEGYLDSLTVEEVHDAATCFLVSQFILDKAARSQFFQQIANQLKPGGILVNSDLSSEKGSADYETILEVWQRVMSGASVSPEGLSRIKDAYDKDVAVLPPTEVASIIESGGFEAPVQLFQAGLIHAWFAKRATGAIA